jgi:hypothetical protein
MATIRFENIDEPSGISTQIPQGYADLAWDNFYSYDTAEFGGGWQVGTRSGSSVGFNGGGSDAGFSREEGTFSLKNGYFTAANLDFVQVRVVAYLDDEKVGSKRFDVVDTEQAFIKFGHKFAHIDEVVITTNDVSQSQIAIDDLKIVFDEERAPPSAAHDQALAAHAAAASDLLLSGLNAPMHHATDGWMLS